jgi:hypothetical protein
VDNPLSRQYARRLAPFLYWFSGKDRGDIHHAATQKFRDARVKSTTVQAGAYPRLVVCQMEKVLPATKMLE